jgi:hypothetical protein
MPQNLLYVISYCDGSMEDVYSLNINQAYAQGIDLGLVGPELRVVECITDLPSGVTYVPEIKYAD